MSHAPKPLLYSYIRFSTAEQASGHSLKRQMNYAKEVAQRKGLELDESLTMRDMGLSAYHSTNIKRGALGLFLEAIEKGKVPVGSVLVIESLDRISRAAPLESQAIISRMINADITVITATDGKEYNKETIKNDSLNLVHMILIMIRANEESEIKSKRVRSALVQQCENWKNGERGFRVKCGKPPKWVKWDNELNSYVFDSREKAIILKKIELYKKGFGGLKIAEQINSEFGHGTVHHTGANVYKEVKRRTLVGELNVTVGGRDYTLHDYYPRLLSNEEFERLISDSQKRGAIKYSQKFVGILSGIDIFKCSCCGKSVGSHVIYRNKEISDVTSSHKRYGCVEARRNNNCNMKSTVQIDVVEEAVMRFCRDKVNLERLLLNNDVKDSLQDRLTELQTKLESIKRDIQKYVEALLQMAGNEPKAIGEQINNLEAEAEQIEKEIDLTQRKQAKISSPYKDEVMDRWLQMTKGIRNKTNDERLAVRQLVKDTFRSVTLMVYDRSVEKLTGFDKLIDAKLAGGVDSSCFDLTFEFHNGLRRVLRLNKHSGQLRAGFDLK